MPSQFSQYASVDREEKWVVLFDRLKAALLNKPFVTIGRRHIQPPGLSPDAQPALFVIQTREKRAGANHGLPNMLTLVGFLIIYVAAPSTDEVPGEETQLAATTLNAAFKAIDDVLQPDDSSGRCTLGGEVYSVSIDGQVDQDPGIFTAQAAAILPIHMLVP